MKAEHVNAFIAPSVDVLERMAKTRVQVGKISRLQRSVTSDALSIVIGLDGEITGSVIFTLAREVAWALAARILSEELPSDARSEVQAVMSEMANMVVGNASGYLYELGLREGITPPTVVMGEQVSFDFSNGAETVLVPLATEAGSVDLIVSVKKGRPT